MLVLTRKSQESIRVGNDITLTVLRVKGNSVRIGIEAPKDVRVVRGELPLHDELVPPHAVTIEFEEELPGELLADESEMSPKGSTLKEYMSAAHAL